MQYEILSEISRTEKNEVYLGSSSGYDDPVIIKKIKNVDRDIYERVQKIDNSHIPHILEMEQEGDVLTILEEYTDGEEIDKYVRDNSDSISEDDIVSLLIQVCDAVLALHSQEPPIIHRDIKPSNILVGQENHVFLVDFDASRIYKEKGEKDTHILGTEEYAPPEQYGYKQTDVRSDIYSLGAVMKELFTENIKENIHPELERIIESCMAFAPEKRFSGVGEVKKSLENYRTAGSKRMMKRVCAVAVGAAVVAVAGVGLYHFSSEQRNHTSVSGSVIGAEATATPYRGEVKSTTLDYIDFETNETKTDIFYYAQKEQNRLPIYVWPRISKEKELKRIKIQRAGKFNTTEIDPEYWSQSEDGLVTIACEYLDTLSENELNDVILDYDDETVNFQIKAIAYNKDAGEGSFLYFSPGYDEYLKTDPGDKKYIIVNPLGRKVTKLVNAETNEEIDKSLYDTEKDPGFIWFKDEFFASEKDGTYLDLYIYYEKLKGIKNHTSYITICVRDRAYIEPVMEKNDYLVYLSEDKDMTMDITWNDGEGKMEGIYPASEDLKEIKKSGYKITQNGVTIKKSVLKKLGPGTYKYILEFGDVALGFSITIKE